MHLAGLGHGDCHGGARRSGARARPSRAGPRRRVAARESSSRFGRLAGEESQCPAGRVGFRVSQRFLSGCGRHGFCADGFAARGLSGPSATECRGSAGRGMAALDAKSRRRLGRFRSEQRPPRSHGNSLRRSQRHDRSIFGGRDGARARVPGPERLVRRRTRRSSEAWTILRRSRRRRAPGTDAGA